MTEPHSTPALGMRWLTILVGLALASVCAVPSLGVPLGAAFYVALVIAYARLESKRRLQNYVAQLQAGFATGAGVVVLVALQRDGHGALGLAALTAVWFVALLVYVDQLRRYGPVQRSSLHDESNRREQ